MNKTAAISLLLLVGSLGASYFISNTMFPSNKELPFLGESLKVEKNGQIVEEHYAIPPFKFVNQDSLPISEQTVAGKVYVADFFFTSCPTICPKVKRQMHRVYEKFKGQGDFVMLSHSIDTKYDTVANLKRYATNLGIESSKWHLLTGEKDHIYEMAMKYMISAVEDGDAPGGYTHSGHIALIDRQRHVRGYYDGTNEREVDQLLIDIDKLLASK